jgi:hypothetical protein
VATPGAVKRCTTCGTLKWLEEFNRDRTTRDGRSPWCGDCERSYAKRYYEVHRERLLAGDRERYANRTEEEKEEYRAKERAYYHRKKAEREAGKVKRAPSRVPEVAYEDELAPGDPLEIMRNLAERLGR